MIRIKMRGTLANRTKAQCFERGAARIFDPFRTLRTIEIIEDTDKAVADAIELYWEATGEYIRIALKRSEKLSKGTSERRETVPQH